MEHPWTALVLEENVSWALTRLCRPTLMFGAHGGVSYHMAVRYSAVVQNLVTWTTAGTAPAGELPMQGLPHPQDVRHAGPYRQFLGKQPWLDTASASHPVACRTA